MGHENRVRRLGPGVAAVGPPVRGARGLLHDPFQPFPAPGGEEGASEVGGPSGEHKGLDDALVLSAVADLADGPGEDQGPDARDHKDRGEG